MAIIDILAVTDDAFSAHSIHTRKFARAFLENHWTDFCQTKAN